MVGICSLEDNVVVTTEPLVGSGIRGGDGVSSLLFGVVDGCCGAVVFHGAKKQQKALVFWDVVTRRLPNSSYDGAYGSSI
jgi:hypothetical protein